MDQHVRRLHHQEPKFRHANRIRVALTHIYHPRTVSRCRIGIREFTFFDSITIDVSRYAAHPRDLEITWYATAAIASQSIHEVLDSKIDVLPQDSDAIVNDSIYGVTLGDDGEAKRGEDKMENRGDSGDCEGILQIMSAEDNQLETACYAATSGKRSHTRGSVTRGSVGRGIYGGEAKRAEGI